jgi:hypothetical protein
MLAALPLVQVLALAGCFRLDVPPGQLRCVDRCPDGMECIDGRCYPEGWTPGSDAALDGLPLDGAPADVDPSWPFPAWGYRKTITVDKEMFRGSDKDFPLWIRRNADPDLDARARADGADLFFTLAGASAKLAHEIEYYEAGTLHAWVKLPSYSEASDAVLLLYYGNPDAASQQDPTQVWTNGYEAVWHMATAPTEPVPDSTGRHPGTPRGQMTAGDLVAGKIGPAIAFDGIDDGLDVGSFDVAGSGGLLLEAWVSVGADQRRVISKSKGINDADNVWTLGVGQLQSGLYTAHFHVATASVITATAQQVIKPDTFTYLAANYTGELMQIYVNGGKFGEASQSGAVATEPSVKVTIGNGPDNNGPFAGSLDEVRVSSVWRTNLWIQSQSRNVHGHGTYITYGPEEARP